MPSPEPQKNGMQIQCHKSVDRLAKQVGEEWPAIFAARDDARKQIAKLKDLILELKLQSNISVVAFGSLAREEWTSGSDVDWTLLIDGPSKMDHFDDTKSVERLLSENGYLEPGPTGTFGSLAGSHELVHHIGGVEDSNQNLTRRILMLFESVSLSDPVTHERVVTAILERYIVGDQPAMAPTNYHVPLFLFNDVVRFWRTMAVDYATKKWQRSNEGWALRNVKLRMSRKLLFTKGMLTCFLCHEDFAGHSTSQEPEIVQRELLTRCFKLSRCSAIGLLADVLQKYAKPETTAKIMGAYNSFLAAINEKSKREELKELSIDDTDNSLFEEQRTISRAFREGLETLFFETNDQLTKLTRRYGVF